MPNRKGLGVSKKYAKGTVHENASGRFVIIDRFAEEDDDKNTPMLEFEWISGIKEGKVEINKEMNMAASIHKFQTSRGLSTFREQKTIENEITFVDKIEQTFDIAVELKKHMGNDEFYLRTIAQAAADIEEANERIKTLENTIDELKKMMTQQHDDIRNMIERNTQTLFQQQQETISTQQETLLKLIDKIVPA